MFAATAAGVYPSIGEAMEAMGQGFDLQYEPDKRRTEVYAKRYGRYRSLAAYLEGTSRKEVTNREAIEHD